MNPTDIGDCVTLNNGVAMPLLGLGTWKLQDGEEVRFSVRAALAFGYQHIDTASMYGNERGVGQEIRDSGVPRDELFITTKLWNDEQGYHAAHAALQRSLDRLGMDYVDLYLIHWPGPHSGETWAAMEEMLAAGTVRAIGVSNFEQHHIDNLLAQSDTVPAVNQCEFHPRLTQPELRAYCAERGILFEGWRPLMEGRCFEISRLYGVAGRHNVDVSQVVLRWCLQHGVSTIPRSRSADHIELNTRLFDFQLSEEEMQEIDAMDQQHRLGPNPQVVNF